MARLNRALLSGSLILLVTLNIYNFFSFIFHFAMARLLSPADYGILATLFSIIYITGIFSESIQTIIAKYAATEQNNAKLHNIVSRAIKKSLKISSLIFIGYVFISIPLSFALKIPYLLLTSTGLMIFAAFLPPITRGALQGIKSFKSLGINFIIEAIIKLSLSIALVMIGWKVYGAIAAAVLAAVIAFLLSIYALKNIFKSGNKPAHTGNIYVYSRPIFFVLFTLSVFYSFDVIIAKMVFPADTAGFYAIASILAKTIFFGTQPISKAMFPISAGEKKGKKNNLLASALAITLICIFIALIVFYFFPEIMIRIFSGRYIQESAGILIYIAIAISLISLSNLILLYKLSIGRVKNYSILAIFPAIEVGLLFFFSSNLVEFSIAFITASAIFLWGSILLFDR